MSELLGEIMCYCETVYIIQAADSERILMDFASWAGDGEWTTTENALWFCSLEGAKKEKGRILKELWPDKANELTIISCYGPGTQ